MPGGFESLGPWVWRLAPYALLLLGGWLLVRSATRMPGASYGGPLEPPGPEAASLEDALKADVELFAGRIGPRCLERYDALVAAARALRDGLEPLGYAVREQPFEAQQRVVTNIEAERAGQSRPQEIVLVGAHYDTVCGTPGANDNASGVAALLALARWARGQRFARTLRFVGFTNEEPPHFTTPRMGSRVYAREARRRGDSIVAMLSLETLGYYSERPGSQAYPFPFGLLYPSRANFVAFVGNYSSRVLVRRVVGEFRRHARFPAEGAAAPGFIPGVGWSDHWSFWKEGYPAVMVTDTALFRYAEYHTPRDTPDRLDYARLARVVGGLQHVLADLAGAEAAR